MFSETVLVAQLYPTRESGLLLNINNGTTDLVTFKTPLRNETAELALTEPKDDPTFVIASAVTEEPTICQSTRPQNKTDRRTAISHHFASLLLNRKPTLEAWLYTVVDQSKSQLEHLVRTSSDFHMMCSSFVLWLGCLVFCRLFDYNGHFRPHQHIGLALALGCASCCLGMLCLLPLYALAMPTILSTVVKAYVLDILGTLQELIGVALDARVRFLNLAAARLNHNSCFSRYELLR
jgi:hypothetical protein